ncbi:MAG: citrate/2-methylcitrate synthase [Phycisphaerales bacterium]|jgi:citrate synthase|nr:citrate/2-methylcitrate synthase [Phycisphaerales bacterium]
MPDATATMTMDKGLDHTIIGESTKSFIDGQKGVLEYVGIDIDTLARNSTFEETCFLLLNDRLPRESELQAFTARLRGEYDLSERMWAAVKALPLDAPPMHVLQTMVAMLALEDPTCDDQSREAEEAKAIRVLAATPAIIANFDRLRRGLEIVKPDRGDNVATSFLRMLTGETPGEASAKALDVCLILHADHGINASTFATMVVMGTESDMYSAITAAIGTLRGPLHGGANERVMHMLQGIDGVDAVEDFVLGRLSRKEKVPGFGHRVYKAIDPRATYLKTFAESIASETGNEDLFRMSRQIEEIMEAHVGGKGIHPNVDFYSATTYFSLGLGIDLFTPIFAMSRNAGWAAHALERFDDNRLIRPRCQYTGPHDAAYVAMDDR